MTDKKFLKWSVDEIIRFLDIYRKYEGLWDANNEHYMKRSAKEHNLKSLINELIEAGGEIPGKETEEENKELQVFIVCIPQTFLFSINVKKSNDFIH